MMANKEAPTKAPGASGSRGGEGDAGVEQRANKGRRHGRHFKSKTPREPAERGGSGTENEDPNSKQHGLPQKENTCNGEQNRAKPKKRTGSNPGKADADSKSVGTDQVKLPFPEYRVVEQAKDQKLETIAITKDPRGDDPSRRITRKATGRGHGRNTESFDPASTLVRPDLRIQVGSNSAKTFPKILKHDDVVIVPELFGGEDDWSLYYKLVEEISELQQSGEKNSDWVAWHEGAHLISKNPEKSVTFQKIIDRLCEYFSIRKQSIGTRFNWYKDSSDWKPFHHDSAAFNPHRAKNQNITVGVSFGATRELAFIRASEQVNGEKVKLYFPQPNNGVFSFGRDANILWKHGINALHPYEQDGKGRISIILWGLAQNVVEEAGSPPLLGSDGKGPHANHGRDRHPRNGGHPRRNRRHGGTGDRPQNNQENNAQASQT